MNSIIDQIGENVNVPEEMSYSAPLLTSYQNWLNEGNWGAYLSSLEREGIGWLFSQNSLQLGTHLAPLAAIQSRMDHSLRLSLLIDLMRSPAGPERAEALYREMIHQKDYEGAAAAAGVAVGRIWERGSRFSDFALWEQRLVDLEKAAGSIPSTARAYLYNARGTALFLGQADLGRAGEAFKTGLFLAEEAQCPALIILLAFGLGNILAHRLELESLEVLLFDTEPLAGLPELPFAAWILHRLLRHIFRFITGDHARAESDLEEIIRHPAFDKAPPALWFFVLLHRLFTACIISYDAAYSVLAEKIRNRTIPEGNHMNQGYLHSFLGYGALFRGNPGKALIHGRETLRRGEMAENPSQSIFAGLLIGQALCDLCLFEEAEAHLLDLIGQSEKNGFKLMSVYAAFELAGLLLRGGKVSQALQLFKKARSLWPQKHSLTCYGRTSDFLEKIGSALNTIVAFPGVWAHPDHALVQIRTLGRFEVVVGGMVILTGKGSGAKSSLLLKALIVFGGIQVPAERLIDLLWPDTDGDIAAGNLRVALYRLRRLGEKEKRPQTPWIFAVQRKISMEKTVCNVDVFNFLERLNEARTQKDIHMLTQALDLYAGDFLPDDLNEGWIITHRESMQKIFAKGAMALAELCENSSNQQLAVPYLERALEVYALNEEIYAALMRAFLDLRYPARALEFFKKAESSFRKELGISPGPTLQNLARQARMGA
jgi:DNA-binding SARP family transcriptional activator